MGAGLQELIDKYHVATVQLDQEIRGNQFLVIANFFDGVELYSEAMGLSACEQNIVRTCLFQSGTEVAMMVCLSKWRQRNPTFRTLLELLLRLNKTKVAAEVCQYLAQNVSTHFVILHGRVRGRRDIKHIQHEKSSFFIQYTWQLALVLVPDTV